jgi:hypothetical protein
VCIHMCLHMYDSYEISICLGVHACVWQECAGWVVI